MLGGRLDDAISIGAEALKMAEQLGLDEVRAHALNNIGTAKIFMAQDDGLDDLKLSIEIATAAHSVEALRGYNNLGVQFVQRGDVRRAWEVFAAGWELARSRYRGDQNALWLMSQRVAMAFGQGKWDDCLRFMDEFIAVAGPNHYQSIACIEFRGRIRLARGDLHGALEDAETDLVRSRAVKDPQRLEPALGFAAFALLSAGRVAECEVRVRELLAMDPIGFQMPNSVSPVLELAWILTRLGRTDEFLERAAKVERRTKWLEAATTFARGEVELSADVCAEIGVVPNEAYTRLRAADKLVQEGRRAEADAQLRRALDFYRSVGASLYIREAEALMAESA
jgi:tetratricopeptide (TPR) repeat protein